MRAWMNVRPYVYMHEMMSAMSNLVHFWKFHKVRAPTHARHQVTKHFFWKSIRFFSVLGRSPTSPACPELWAPLFEKFFVRLKIRFQSGAAGAFLKFLVTDRWSSFAFVWFTWSCPNLHFVVCFYITQLKLGEDSFRTRSKNCDLVLAILLYLTLGYLVLLYSRLTSDLILP